jgi:hypothetical protein
MGFAVDASENFLVHFALPRPGFLLYYALPYSFLHTWRVAWLSCLPCRFWCNVIVIIISSSVLLASAPQLPPILQVQHRRFLQSNDRGFRAGLQALCPWVTWHASCTAQFAVNR